MLTVGLLIGATGGIVGVRALEPGRPEQPDSLQLMLDSIANGTASKSAAAVRNDERSARRASDSADAENRPQRIADSVAAARAAAAEALPVPDVIGLEEGLARTRVVESGHVVGTVQFEDSRTAAGIVLRTVPAAGESVAPGESITLILSNGRTPPGGADAAAPLP